MFLSRLKMVRNFNLQLRVKYALHFCADPQPRGGGTRPENWWGCAAGRWKLDPKRSRKKLNLGPKRSIFVKIGSFCTPKDSFAVGGWEKYPKKIVLDPAKVKKGGQNRGTYVSPIT